MTGTDAGARSQSLRLAHGVSVICHPICQVYALLPLVGVVQNGLGGLLFGLAAATFLAGIPGLGVYAAVRSGAVNDMDVSQRGQRPLVIGLCLLAAMLGGLLLVALRAPGAVLLVVAAMVAGGLVSAVISLFWKVSVHAAAITGVAVVLALMVSPWAGLSAAVTVVPLVLWARVRLGSHSVAQVVAGAVAGVVVSGLVLSLGGS